MKIKYAGRKSNLELQLSYLSKKYTVKDNVISDMTEADYKAIIANGDNARVFQPLDLTPKAVKQLVREAAKAKELKEEAFAQKIKDLQAKVTQAIAANKDALAKLTSVKTPAENARLVKVIDETSKAIQEAEAKLIKTKKAGIIS